MERKYELYTQEAKANAYGTFAQMRAHDPVFRQPGMDGHSLIWFVSGYEEAAAVLRDDRRFVRDSRNALPAHQIYLRTPEEELFSNHMLNKDGVDHRRLRGLVSKAFTPSRIEALRPRIQNIADALLDEVFARGNMDLMADFAFHLPTIVISEMLGVPREDRMRFQAWSNAVVSPALDPESQAQSLMLLREFVAYLAEQFSERRLTPRHDLISALLAAEQEGDRLTEQELYSTMILLIVAGHETTVSLIGNAMVALWESPEQMDLLREQPALMPAAVEEFLRYDGSVERALPRWVAEDVVLAGHQMERGDLVIVILAAANRDEAHFVSADELDIARESNKHLGFGLGVHYCLGAPLARVEVEIALNTLLRRLPGLRPAMDLGQRRWMLTPMFRRLASLPAAWDII